MLERRVSLWLITAALVMLMAACAMAPPVQEMSDARQAIMAAEEADAANLAPDQLREARRFLEQAEEHLRQEAYGVMSFETDSQASSCLVRDTSS